VIVSSIRASTGGDRKHEYFLAANFSRHLAEAHNERTSAARFFFAWKITERADALDNFHTEVTHLISQCSARIKLFFNKKVASSFVFLNAV
jgi:hypothetical protein